MYLEAKKEEYLSKNNLFNINQNNIRMIENF